MNGIQVKQYILIPNYDGSVNVSYTKDNRRLTQRLDLSATLDRLIKFQEAHVERCYQWFLLAATNEQMYLADTDRRQLLEYLPDLTILPPGMEKCSLPVKNLWYLEQFVSAYNKLFNTTLTTQQIAEQQDVL